MPNIFLNGIPDFLQTKPVYCKEEKTYLVKPSKCPCNCLTGWSQWNYSLPTSEYF